MGSQLSVEVKQHEYWLRLILALEVHVTRALLDIVHNRNKDPGYQGLPEKHVDLYNYLKRNHNSILQQLKKNKVLNKYQLDLLLPANGQTDSLKWDITLIVIVIRYCVNIPPPINGWKKQLVAGDNTKAAGAIKARELRNWLKHGRMDEVQTKAQFDGKWAEINNLLICLDYNNIPKFNDLETDDVLEDYIEEAKKIFTDLVTKEIEQTKKDVLQTVMVNITALTARVQSIGLYLQLFIKYNQSPICNIPFTQKKSTLYFKEKG